MIRRTNGPDQRRRGSVLLFVTVGLVMIAGLTAAVSTMTLSTHRAAADAFDYEVAKLAAESGVAFLHANIIADSRFLDDLSDFQFEKVATSVKTELTQKYTEDMLRQELGGSEKTVEMLLDNKTLEGVVPEMKMGRGKFQIMSVAKDRPSRWTTLIVGSGDAHDYRLGVTIGPARLNIPDGLVLSGSGNPMDSVLGMGADSLVTSYMPSGSLFPLGGATGQAEAKINGSVTLAAGSSIDGDLTTEGTISDPTHVTGTTTELADPTELDSVDNTVDEILAQSQASNNNAVLPLIFGTDFNPHASSENYGDLKVTGGNYTIPAGTYRFKKFGVFKGATITLDTSGGPVVLVYVGDGGAAGMDFDGNVELRVDSGGTGNPAQIILGPTTNLDVAGNSTIGQDMGLTDSGGALQILGKGDIGPTGNIGVSQGSKLYGRVHAAGHNATISDTSRWFGSGVMRSLDVVGGALGISAIAIDESPTGLSLEGTGDPIIYAIWDAN